MDPITVGTIKEVVIEATKKTAEKSADMALNYTADKIDEAMRPDKESNALRTCEKITNVIVAGTLSDAAIETRVEAAAHSACLFFGIPDAELTEGGAIGVYRNSDIFLSSDVFEYNLEQFKDMSCVSFEDMTKVWAHECGHRILRMDFQEPWAQELGADFFSGVRSEMLGLPSSNFEEMLASTKASPSHPNGIIRVMAIEYGREVVRRFQAQGITPTIENCKAAFANSPFAQVSHENFQGEGRLAAFVDDKTWYEKNTKTAQENANYYSKEAKKAADNGDLRKASDMQSKADYYNNEVKNAKIQDILPNKELSQSLDKEINRVETSEGNEADGPKRVTCINERYLGQNHPDTGVPYVEKTVKSADGNEVVGVFPQFDSEYDAYLPENLLQESDSKQFAEANRQLKEKYDSDPGFASKFNERQCDDIENGRTPYGYVWHHSEETGKLQLVDYDTHERTRHTGGKAIWGGGRENR